MHPLNDYFNLYDVVYMFRTRGFIFRKTFLRTVMVQYITFYMNRCKQSLFIVELPWSCQ